MLNFKSLWEGFRLSSFSSENPWPGKKLPTICLGDHLYIPLIYEKDSLCRPPEIQSHLLTTQWVLTQLYLHKVSRFTEIHMQLRASLGKTFLYLLRKSLISEQSKNFLLRSKLMIFRNLSLFENISKCCLTLHGEILA